MEAKERDHIKWMMSKRTKGKESTHPSNSGHITLWLQTHSKTRRNGNKSWTQVMRFVVCSAMDYQFCNDLPCIVGCMENNESQASVRKGVTNMGRGKDDLRAELEPETVWTHGSDIQTWKYTDLCVCVYKRAFICMYTVRVCVYIFPSTVHSKGIEAIPILVPRSTQALRSRLLNTIPP